MVSAVQSNDITKRPFLPRNLCSVRHRIRSCRNNSITIMVAIQNVPALVTFEGNDGCLPEDGSVESVPKPIANDSIEKTDPERESENSLDGKPSLNVKDNTVNEDDTSTVSISESSSSVAKEGAESPVLLDAFEKEDFSAAENEANGLIPPESSKEDVLAPAPDTPTTPTAPAKLDAEASSNSEPILAHAEATGAIWNENDWPLNTEAESSAVVNKIETPQNATIEEISAEKPEAESNSTATEESTTPSLTLAQRMKEMFDSSAPDQPSNAFGKTTKQSSMPLSSGSGVMVDGETETPKAVSFAKDMKLMFDSSSPDESSRAFGGVIARTQKQPSSPVGKASTDTVGRNGPNNEVTKPSSPISVADQMVSMLWATSSPAKKPPSPTTDLPSSGNRDVDEKTKRNLHHAVYRDTAIGEEDEDDIEEITVCEDVANEDDFEEFIEEVIIEDDNHKDYMSVTTGDESIHVKSLFELSPGFVDTIENGPWDGHSFEEITADDSEYDERTIGENAVEEDQENRMESKDRVAEKGDEVNQMDAHSETKVALKTIGCDDTHSSGDDLSKASQPSKNETQKKAVTEAKRVVDLNQRDTTTLANLSSVPQPSTLTIHKPTMPRDSPRIVSPKIRKLNPRIGMDPSATGTLAEKLKIFDSPKAALDPRQDFVVKQTWRKPKLHIESQRDKPIEEVKKDEGYSLKTPVVLPVFEPRKRELNKSLAKSCNNASGYNEEDKALVETIISLVKEPGAMHNKHTLAERIASLLTSKIEDGAKASTPNPSLSSAISNSAKEPLPRSKRLVGTTAYLNRKKDGFQDPGLKQMRKDVEMQKKKLHHVDDPDTTAIRHAKRINTEEWENEKGKQLPMKSSFCERQTGVDPDEIVEKQEEVPMQAPMRFALPNTRKAVNPEEIMARIWPKTQDGAKLKTKATSPFRSSKSVAFENPRTTPRKLGGRFKMFDAPPKNAVVLKKRMFTEPPKALPRKANVTVAAENGFISAEGMRNQISEEALKGVVGFQRLWRTRTSKRNILSRGRGATLQKTKGSSSASPSGNADGNSDSKTRSIPIVFHPQKVSVPISAPTPQSTTEPLKAQISNRLTSGGGCYSLEDFEKGRFDRSIVEMERWEVFLSDESFQKHFGLSKDEFYKQPKWKRDNQKRKVRVAF